MYKAIQDSLGFWIPRRGFRIPGTGFKFLSLELGFWIPIVSESLAGFLQLYPGFQIPQAKIYRIPLLGVI